MTLEIGVKMDSTQPESDPIDKWLASVSYAHSSSPATEENYRRHFKKYLKFVGRTAKQIIDEYEAINNYTQHRKFKDKIADELKLWIISLRKQGFADSSIRTMIGVAQSFYKYSRIDIGFIPTAQDHITYHNRDIERKEIDTILSASIPRDRAFYALMAQSGLRPVTICKLKIKHIEYDKLLREESPVKIDIPEEIAKGKYHSYFTFITDDAIKHLRSYLKTRNVTKESYLFVKAGTENTPMKPAAFSKQFNKLVRKLREKGSLEFEIRDNKPSELRLYNLRKFFEKFAHKAGEEFSEFWMGHKVGVQDHYRAKDPEHHRKIYSEKAVPDLRIDLKTPLETEKTIIGLKKENEVLEERLQFLENKIDVIVKWQSEVAKIEEGDKWEVIDEKFIQERDILKKRNKVESHKKTDEEIQWEKMVNQLRMQIEDSKRQKKTA